MFEPSAKVICDSLNTANGSRLTTVVLKYHRFIHPEFLAHRMFSRNSSSNRAIPSKKLIQNVINDNIYPLHWGKNQSGMQAETELSLEEIEKAIAVWDEAKDNAISAARKLMEIGVHKQIANRVIETFSSITVIVSATDWGNFFDQRCHKDAQPEIQALANTLFDAYTSSNPQELNPGEWHLPYSDDLSRDFMPDSLHISVGRCARVSYLNHEGVRNKNDDMALHDRLLSSNPQHLSPFEHQAIALNDNNYYANFKGFMQYRKQVENSSKM